MFFWFLVEGNLIKYIVPEFEYFKFGRGIQENIFLSSRNDKEIFYMAKLMSHSQDYNKALEYLDRALEIEPCNGLYRT